MSFLTNAQKFLGLETPVMLRGYRSNSRSGNMPTCERCGAMVSYETQQLHTDWHEQGLR
ncbi:hypothetical protein [Paeniglutamicibacter gangotriensis]|uniref:hypothetical protein n=1 Tax=Paeniglutamicibacter gangotriensis TaxID=254787 RepID=UPI00165EFFF9|nr:hypothetical protein [Paeniglutamicibacter gangotriensis]